MSIRIFYEDTSFRYKGWRKTKQIIEELIFREKMLTGEINVIITTDNNLIALNRKFLEHDYYTDVITFNYNEGNLMNGEVYISVDTVKKNARTYSVSSNEEMKRVILHGILHLAGYDDKKDLQRQEMRKMEDFWIDFGGK